MFRNPFENGAKFTAKGQSESSSDLCHGWQIRAKRLEINPNVDKKKNSIIAGPKMVIRVPETAA